MLPEAKSCRSASLRLMFLKNHLGTRGRVSAGGDSGQLCPPALQGMLLAPSLSTSTTPATARLLLNPYSTPTHGSGSRLFTVATKL